MYTDAVHRVSIRQLAAAHSPRAWSELELVRVELGDQATVVKLVRLPDDRGYGGFRRWLVCPGCAAPVQTVALAGDRWGCRRCFKWRSRRRRLAEVLSGAATDAEASADSGEVDEGPGELGNVQVTNAVGDLASAGDCALGDEVARLPSAVPFQA